MKLAESGQGRGILGVVDGFPPKGIEDEAGITWRKGFLRKIGQTIRVYFISVEATVPQVLKDGQIGSIQPFDRLRATPAGRSGIHLKRAIPCTGFGRAS
ncbi:MAG: adenosine-specific kinase [Anaerolineales bacterium]|nr:adenosine-specific kinase [Anaerolineales bacterium]